jgi:hypothetical protein
MALHLSLASPGRTLVQAGSGQFHQFRDDRLHLGGISSSEDQLVWLTLEELEK